MGTRTFTKHTPDGKKQVEVWTPANDDEPAFPERCHLCSNPMRPFNCEDDGRTMWEYTECTSPGCPGNARAIWKIHQVDRYDKWPARA